MIIRRKVGPKGQVVIPKDIRIMLGISEGSEILFEVQNEQVIIKREPEIQEFLEDFYTSPHKLKKEINLKEILDTQLEERRQ